MKLLNESKKPFQGQYWRIENNDQLNNAMESLKMLKRENDWIEIQFRTPKTRTLQQNSAMHLWFTMVADELNKAGLDMRKVLKESFDIYWTSHSVKEFLFKPIMQIVTENKSTTKLKRGQVSEIYDILNAKFAEWGIHVPFPSIDEES